MPFYKQVVSIYGANTGLLDNADAKQVQAIEVAFHEFIERDRKAILDTIESERALSDETKALLDAAIVDFKQANAQYYSA